MQASSTQALAGPNKLPLNVGVHPPGNNVLALQGATVHHLRLLKE